MLPDQTYAVVLKVTDHGESDKIVTFCSPIRGKLTGIAKGAKRSKKRFVNKLEIFSHLNITYVENGRSTLLRIDQAELILSFPSLRKNYKRYTAASLICEQMLYWIKENDGDKELFELLIWALESLENGKSVVGTVILFHIRMFTILGFQPRISGCIHCGRADHEGAPYRFNMGRSDLICKKCGSDAGVQGTLISINTVKLLEKAQELPLHKLGRLKFSTGPAKEAIALLKGYGRHLLQRETHSWKAFESIWGQSKIKY
ncbi:MAG: DNA repair protein RecO [Thermodesulfobacteriota bacterium]|nr:DNA repair protein RecO [Thermodesulfobacteriota bacterium]